MRIGRTLLTVVVLATLTWGEPRAVTTPAELAAVEAPRAVNGAAAGLKLDPKLEVVVYVYDAMPAGVAVGGGRTFLTFPWGQMPNRSLVEIGKDGALRAYPSETAKLSSVQGICIAGDYLYALDVGAAKLHMINLGTNDLEKTYDFPAEVLGKRAYLNDLRVDEKAKVAYISDSVGGGILVLDLASGRSARRLSKHPSARAVPGLKPVVEGKEIGTGNTDGIALSPDGNTVYYSAFSSRTLYAVGTRELRDALLEDEAIAPQKLADKPSCNDGMTTDSAGNVYSTDYEDHAIRVTSPAGEVKVLVQDPRIVWPDALWADGGYIYITVNQLNRTAGWNGGKDVRQPPYALYRYPTAVQ